MIQLRNLEPLLDSIQTAYYIGSDTISTLKNFKNDNVFDQLLLNVIKTQLSLDELLLLEKCSASRNRGLQAARRGEPNKAMQAFSEVRGVTEAYPLSREALLLIETFLAAAEAYLDYQKQDFNAARRRLDYAIELDMELETSYGISTLIFHRIQITHNMMRIDAKCRQPENAVVTGIKLLEFLEKGDGQLPSLLNAQQVPLKISIQLSELMVQQIINEIALVMCMYNAAELVRIFEHVRTYLERTVPQQNAFKIAYEWLELKEHFVTNNLSYFLSSASQFIVSGNIDRITLWYATLVNTVVICRQLGTLKAVSLLTEICDDLKSHPHIPSVLAQSLRMI